MDSLLAGRKHARHGSLVCLQSFPSGLPTRGVRRRPARAGSEDTAERRARRTTDRESGGRRPSPHHGAVRRRVDRGRRSFLAVRRRRPVLPPWSADSVSEAAEAGSVATRRSRRAGTPGAERRLGPRSARILSPSPVAHGLPARGRLDRRAATRLEGSGRAVWAREFEDSNRARADGTGNLLPIGRAGFSQQGRGKDRPGSRRGAEREQPERERCRSSRKARRAAVVRGRRLGRAAETTP